MAARLLADGRASSRAAVHGIVVLDTAAKSDFANFRNAGFDAYLVRPIRPSSVLTHVGVRTSAPAEVPDRARTEHKPQWRPGAAAPLILLVEDNDINALLARRMLEKVGCEVRLSVNGRDAVEAFRRVLAGNDAAFDLVLMDVHMPVMGGLEATALIKELYASQAASGLTPPPIVALTANAFDEDRRRCVAAGMDDYLAKPFDREELHRILERWCGDGDRTCAA
jgi:CheY-like chemotaxis protein